MFKFLAGMAAGWLGFTPEGRKVLSGVVRKATEEITTTLREQGILLDDDVPKAAMDDGHTTAQ